jgi:hypothetical protein
LKQSAQFRLVYGSGLAAELPSLSSTLLPRADTASKLIDRWAEANRFEIVTAKRRTFVPLGGQWKGISFFRVRVRDAVEGTKDCWLRFRDWAQDPKEIQVIWDAKVYHAMQANSETRRR